MIEQRIPFTCAYDCICRCELHAVVRDGRLVRIDTAASDDPRLRRVPCARGRSNRRMQEAAERVHHPLKRVGPRGGGRFERISWEQALDEVAERLAAVARQYGPAAILLGRGAGAIGGIGFSGMTAAERFFSFWGGVSQTMGNMSNPCTRLAAAWMLGKVPPADVADDLMHSRLILLWSYNPAELRMGSNIDFAIARARENGARVVLLDPRLSDTGVLADEWVPVRPGSDAALIAAMSYVIETEGLADQDFLARCTAGYDAYREYVLGRSGGAVTTPQWAEGITGVPAAKIRELAVAYAADKPAALLAGWGAQRSRHGEQVSRALIALAAVSGNIGLRGGGVPSLGLRSGMIDINYLPFGPHAPARSLSNTVWAKEILSGELDPPIRMLYVVGTNMVNKSPDVHLNVKALGTIDHIVVNEQYMTPTARLADMVLPVSSALQMPDLMVAGADDSVLFDSRPSVPQGETRTDYWIFSRLAERLGVGDQYAEGRSEADWIEWSLAGKPVNRVALARDGQVPGPGAEARPFEAFRRDPEAHPLKTPSGRIEIVNPAAREFGLPEIPSYIPVPAGDPQFPLHMITPHSKARINSTLHTNPWLGRLNPPGMWINPADAAARGLVEGELAEISSPQGAIRLPARLTERIMPGVVAVHQGAWFDPESPDLGGCVNVLTESLTTPSGAPALHSTMVQVRRIGP